MWVVGWVKVWRASLPAANRPPLRRIYVTTHTYTQREANVRAEEVVDRGEGRAVEVPRQNKAHRHLVARGGRRGGELRDDGLLVLIERHGMCERW